MPCHVQCTLCICTCTWAGFLSPFSGLSWLVCCAHVFPCSMVCRLSPLRILIVQGQPILLKHTQQVDIKVHIVSMYVYACTCIQTSCRLHVYTWVECIIIHVYICTWDKVVYTIVGSNSYNLWSGLVGGELTSCTPLALHHWALWVCPKHARLVSVLAIVECESLPTRSTCIIHLTCTHVHLSRTMHDYLHVCHCEIQYSSVEWSGILV